MATVAGAEQPFWQRLAVWDSPGQIDLAATKADAPASDRDAALLLDKLYPGKIHYVPGSPGRWYVWNGRCHQPDESNSIGRLLLHYAGQYQMMLRSAQEAFNAMVARTSPQATGPDLAKLQAKMWKDQWGAITGYAARLSSAAGLAALRGVLGEIRGVSADTMADRWPYHLNVANGILDLRTGQLLEHDPAAMMTYCLDAAWDPAARCPKYSRLLYRSVGEVDETYTALVKALGYSLIGENPFNKVIFLNGPPANGKTKLLQVLSTLLGPLAHNAEPSLVTRQRDGRNAREEHAIRGVRAICISETSSGIHMDEAQLKRLTGETEITTHQHYAVTKNRTMVTWLIIFATNAMPSILHLDAGVLRRLLVYPMGPSIPEPEKKRRRMDLHGDLLIPVRLPVGLLGACYVCVTAAGNLFRRAAEIVAAHPGAASKRLTDPRRAPTMSISHEVLEGVSAMPRRATTRTRPAATSGSITSSMTKMMGDGRMPGALRTTIQGAEALSVGLVQALAETVVTAVRGAQEVGAELGTTALSAIRGSIRAAEEIGGDLGRLAMNATSGAVGTSREVGGGVGRAAVGAAQGAAHAVQRAGVNAARMVGFPARRPLQRAERSRRRRTRRARAA